jgi:hypothetical protein
VRGWGLRRDDNGVGRLFGSPSRFADFFLKGSPAVKTFFLCLTLSLAGGSVAFADTTARIVALLRFDTERFSAKHLHENGKSNDLFLLASGYIVQ